MTLTHQSHVLELPLCRRLQDPVSFCFDGWRMDTRHGSKHRPTSVYTCSKHQRMFFLLMCYTKMMLNRPKTGVGTVVQTMHCSSPNNDLRCRICQVLLGLLDKPQISTEQLCKYIESRSFFSDYTRVARDVTGKWMPSKWRLPKNDFGIYVTCTITANLYTCCGLPSWAIAIWSPSKR